MVIVEFFAANKLAVVGVLFFASELLGSVKSVKANSVFQLVNNALKSLFAKVSGK